MTSYREAAVTLWGEAGAYMHDTYAQLRVEHFPDLPEELPMVIGIVAYGACLGLTRGGWDYGPRITVASNRFKHGHRAVENTILHEMLHADLMLRGLDPSHDGDPWYQAVRKLSPTVLGHDVHARRGGDRKSVRVPNPKAGEDGQPATVVRKVAVASAVPHRDVAGWPRAFRPANYDWGEPIKCPSY